jgi:hypothetical protein
MFSVAVDFDQQCRNNFLIAISNKYLFLGARRCRFRADELVKLGIRKFLRSCAGEPCQLQRRSRQVPRCRRRVDDRLLKGVDAGYELVRPWAAVPVYCRA